MYEGMKGREEGEGGRGGRKGGDEGRSGREGKKGGEEGRGGRKGRKGGETVKDGRPGRLEEEGDRRNLSGKVHYHSSPLLKRRETLALDPESGEADWHTQRSVLANMGVSGL